MKVYASLDNIISAAAQSGVDITQPEIRGRAYQFRLLLDKRRGEKTIEAKYHRRSHHGHLVNAVCWHGYRDFFIRLFALEPTARAVTGVARYNGIAGFYNEFPATAHRNIGSQMQPLSYQDACDCEERP